MTAKHRRALLPLLALTTLIAAGGCGESDSTTTASLTKKQFIVRAGAICEKAEEEQYLKASSYVKKHPNAKEKDLVVPAGLPPLEKETQELKALGAPSGDEAKVEAIVTAMEQAVKEGKENPAAIMAARKKGPFQKANELAGTYGLQACSGNP